MFVKLDCSVLSVAHHTVARFPQQPVHQCRQKWEDVLLATHKRKIAGRGEEGREATRESIFSAFWLRSSVVSVLISLISGSEAFLLHIKIKLISRGGPAGTHARSLLWAASGRRSASHCTHRGVLQTVDPFPLTQLNNNHPPSQQTTWRRAGRLTSSSLVSVAAASPT